MSAPASNDRLGFIGLGIMGSSMAKNLLRAGYPLGVYSRSREKIMSLVHSGAKHVRSPAELSAECEVLLISVSDGAALENVIFGEHGVCRASALPKVVVDLSTVSPILSRRCHTELAALGVDFLDAPVSGGDIGARNATLTIMVGGERHAFERVFPILGTLGNRIAHTGGSGTGQLTKCVNQVAVALGVAAMTEGLVLAAAAGLDLQETLDVIRSGAAGSWSLDNYAPRLLSGDFKPGFRAEHMLKDLRIALEEAKSIGIDLPVTDLVCSLYTRLCEGGEELGNHALLKIYSQPEKDGEA